MELAASGGGQMAGPVIATTNERGNRDKADPSNLPYLYKNPAIWKKSPHGLTNTNHINSKNNAFD